MKILITGVCGFLGSKFAERLLQNPSNYVIGVDMSDDKSKVLNLLENNRFKLHHQDLSNVSNCEWVFAHNPKIDVVFHLASNSEDGFKNNPINEFDNTLKTTFNVLCQMVRYKVRNFVFTSSVSTLNSIQSHYDACKMASESIISGFCNVYGLNGRIVKLPNVVGRGMNNNVVYDLIMQLRENKDRIQFYNDKSQYIYVEDAIEALIHAYESPYNCVLEANSEYVDTKDIANKVSKVMGLDPEMIELDTIKGSYNPVENIDNYEVDYNSMEALDKAIKEM